jgi:cytochrome c-type biogenesis protein CcmH
MNRRRAITRLAAGGAALFGLPAGARQDSVRADRLYDPSKVQLRAATTPLDNDETVKALERRLKCTCGCNLDIYTCRTTDFTCAYSPALHREILDLMEGGKTSDEVIAAMVAKYGEQMLMAPKAEGFNLAGYLLPGAAVALAGSLLVLVLARRSRRLRTAAVPASAGPHPDARINDPDEDERLRRALAEVED